MIMVQVGDDEDEGTRIRRLLDTGQFLEVGYEERKACVYQMSVWELL